MGACASKAEHDAAIHATAASDALGTALGSRQPTLTGQQHPAPRTCLRLQPWQPHTPGLVFAHGMILDNSACSQPAVVMPTTSTQLMLTVASREDTAGALGVDSDSHYLKCLLDVSMAGAGERLTLLGSALAAMVAQGQHGDSTAADSLGVACQKPWLTRPHVKLRLHLHVLNAGSSASEWVLCIDHELPGTTAIPPATIAQPALQPAPAHPTPAQSTTSQDTQLIIKALLSRAPASAGLAPPISGVPSSTHSHHLQRSAMMVSEAPWLVTLICLQDGVILSQNDASAHYLGRQLPCVSRLDTAAGTTAPCSPAGIHPAVQLLLSLLLVLEETSGEQEASQALTDIAQGRTWSKVVKVPFTLMEALEEVCGMPASEAESTNGQGPSCAGPAMGSAASASAFAQPPLTPASWNNVGDGGMPPNKQISKLTSALLTAAFHSVDSAPPSRLGSFWRAESHSMTFKKHQRSRPSSVTGVRTPVSGADIRASLGSSEEPVFLRGPSRTTSVTWAQPQLPDRSSRDSGRDGGRNRLTRNNGTLADWVASGAGRRRSITVGAQQQSGPVTSRGVSHPDSLTSQGWEASTFWARSSICHTSGRPSPSDAERASGRSGPARAASVHSVRYASMGQVQRCSPASPSARDALQSRSFGGGQGPQALRQWSTGAQPVRSTQVNSSCITNATRVSRILDTIAQTNGGTRPRLSQKDSGNVLVPPFKLMADAIGSDQPPAGADDDQLSRFDSFLSESGLLQATSVGDPDQPHSGLQAPEDPDSLRVGLRKSMSRFSNTVPAGALGSEQPSQNLEDTQGWPGWSRSQGHQALGNQNVAIAAAGVAVTAELLGEIKHQLQAGPWCWHEVFLKRVVDPATGRPALLLVQSNVSERAELEAQLAELSEAQLQLLSQIFPRYVIEQLGVNGGLTVANLAQAARTHPCATVLFMDLVGFTRLSQSMSAELIIIFINDLFGTFDLLVDKHGVQKIDCMGDCLVIGAGVLRPDDEGFNVVDYQHSPEECAARVFACAQDMIRAAAQMRLPLTGERLEIRIGINSGTCVSGLIGLRLPKWTVLGDTVNTAARMEQTCVPGKVQVSTTTHALLSGLDEQLQPTGGVLCKGKGVMDTWIWTPPTEWENEPPLPAAFFVHANIDTPFVSQDQQTSFAQSQRTGQFGSGIQIINHLGCIPETLSTRTSTCTTTYGNAIAAASGKDHTSGSVHGNSATLPTGLAAQRSSASRSPTSRRRSMDAGGYKPFGANSSNGADMGNSAGQQGGASSNSGPLRSTHLVKLLAQARKGWAVGPSSCELNRQSGALGAQGQGSGSGAQVSTPRSCRGPTSRSFDLHRVALPMVGIGAPPPISRPASAHSLECDDEVGTWQ